MTIIRNKTGGCCPQMHHGFNGVTIGAFCEGDQTPPGDVEWLTGIVECQSDGLTGVTFCEDEQGGTYWWCRFLTGRNGECFSKQETRILRTESDPVTRRDAEAVRAILRGLVVAGREELRAELTLRPYPCRPARSGLAVVERSEERA